MDKKTFRLEANAGAVCCFGILAGAMTGYAMFSSSMRTNKAIALKELECELRKRNANMEARCK